MAAIVSSPSKPKRGTAFHPRCHHRQPPRVNSACLFFPSLPTTKKIPFELWCDAFLHGCTSTATSNSSSSCSRRFNYTSQMILFLRACEKCPRAQAAFHWHSCSNHYFLLPIGITPCHLPHAWVPYAACHALGCSLFVIAPHFVVCPSGDRFAVDLFAT